MDVVACMMQYMSYRDMSCAAAVCKLWKEQADPKKVRESLHAQFRAKTADRLV